MNLTSVSTIKELLSKHGATPSKTMGQNFLVDNGVLAKIIEVAQLSKSDTVLEVGPGIGTLTQELAKTTKKVIAIEKDRKMAQILKETLRDCKNVKIINGDIRFLNPRSYILSDKYKIVANIPYYLTSPLIRKFLEEKNPPELMVLMVQKEVAQRICANIPNMSLLAVSVQFYAEPKIISYVKKEYFFPSPKVDSAIIKIVLKASGGQTSAGFDEKFFKIVKAGFSQPRKQLANNLSKVLKKDRRAVELWLSQNDIKPEQRAQTLSIENWKDLASSYGQIDNSR